MAKRLKKGQKTFTSMPVTVKGIDKEKYKLTMVASTQDVDRHGDTIMQDGWDLKPFKKNPVILNSHNYYDATEVIARANKTRIEGKGKSAKLVQEWEFAVEENPKAKIIFDLYAGGFLHASSVGFIPREFKKNKDGSTDYFTIVKQELLEVSAVGVPANAAATLAKSVGVDVAELKDAIGVDEEEETPEEEVEETVEEETPEEDETPSEDEAEEDDAQDEETETDEEEDSESEEEETPEEETETEEEESEEEVTPEPKAAPKPTRAQISAKVINRLNRQEEATLKAVYATIGKMLNGDEVKNLDHKTGRKVQKRNYHKVIRKLLKAK